MTSENEQKQGKNTFRFESKDVCPECGKIINITIKGSYEYWNCEHCGHHQEKFKV